MELEDAKALLLERCAPLFAEPPPQDVIAGAARAHAASGDGATAGIAIGHSICRSSGRPRLEVRVERAFDDRLEEVEARVRSLKPDGFAEPRTLLTTTPVVLLNHADPGAAVRRPLLGAKAAPLHLGVSIGHPDGYAGSLGCFVTVEGDKAPHILSCSHVLAMMGRATKGDHIYHPGRPDQDPLDEGGRAAVLSKFFTVFSPGLMEEDAALATVDPRDIAGNVIPRLDCVPEALRGQSLGAPLKVAELDARLRERVEVAKIGRTTGWTTAVLTSVSFRNLRTTFIDRSNGREVQHTFTGVHETGWSGSDPCFAEPGDSGSLVFTLDDLRPIGLHFAAALDDTPTGYVIPWEKIENRFKCSLLMEA